MSVQGKTEPRLFTPPLRELTPETSLGFACCEYAKTVLGETLYPWQEWALQHMLEITGSLGGEWHFRFRTIVIMVARQNGKTKLSAVLASFFLNILGAESIFGTSLDLAKAEEVWELVVAYQESVPALARLIGQISRTNGRKFLKIDGGCVYKTGAPSRHGGRGDSNDLVLIDELREQRNWELWSAAAPSINAKPKGLIVCFTNAGDPESIVLRTLRSRAMAAMGAGEALDLGGEDVDAEDLALFEWSAPEGAAMDDEAALAQANPALGYGRITERALRSDRSTMPENKFRAEDMCQQVETVLRAPFPDGAWAAGVDMASEIAAESPIYYGIDMHPDRTWVSVAACGQRADGGWHVEVIARRSGVDWAVEWFRARAVRQPMPLAFQSRGAPVSGLAEEICTLAGVERCAVEGPDLPAGWGRFYDAVAAGLPAAPEDPEPTGPRIYHLPQPVLDTAAKTMQLKPLGNGTTVPDRTKSPDDISPLVACIMAYTAATALAKPEKKIYESAYASGAALAFV